MWAIRPTPLSPQEPDIGRIALPGIRADASQVSATPPLGAPERIRVLVVDDNDGFRESLVFLLSGEDLEVIGQACSGTEAIEMVRRLAPDVVLMDIRMPEMDGIEATRRLKAARPSVGVDRPQQHGGAALGPRHAGRRRDRLRARRTPTATRSCTRCARRSAAARMLSPEVTPVVIEEMTDALERERRRARQLEMAQEALLERAAHRQQLIGRVGHELRTPVTVILGIAQTMQRGQMPGRATSTRRSTSSSSAPRASRGWSNGSRP